MNSRPGFRQAVLRATGAGWVHGSLLYGAVVSLLHVVYDHLPSTWNALVLLVATTLLYGAVSAAVFAGVAACLGLARRVLPGGREEHPGSGRGGLLAGAFTFNLVFWFFAANYGLTYDEVPFGPPAGAWGMVGYLALRTLALAVAVAVGSWVFVRLWRWLAATGRRGRVLAAAYALVLVVQLGLAALYRPPGPPPGVSQGGGAPPAAVPTRPAYKVALVAADGADWRVIRPLLEAGQMPNLARLMARGVHGPLATLHDSNSAVIWASIYTGTRPETHGVQDFYTIRLPGMTGPGIYPVHRTFFKELAGYLERVGLAERVTMDRFSMREPPLWEIAAALGRSIGVVDGYYYSFPAPPVSDPRSFFVAYGADRFHHRAEGRPGGAGSAPEAGQYVQPVSLLDEIGPLLDGYEFDWQSKTLLALLSDHPQPDFVSLYSHQPDAVQHWTWHAYQPELYLGVSREEVAAHGDDIPAFHRQLDAFLGHLAERLDDDTVLILASDHGHSPTLLHAMDTQHRHGPPGILVMAGGPLRKGIELDGATIYDLFPTILYLLGMPVPGTSAGHVLTGALDPEVLARQPVATIPSYAGLVPERRPPSAAPGSDREREREELEKLKALGYVQ